MRLLELCHGAQQWDLAGVWPAALSTTGDAGGRSVARACRSQSGPGLLAHMRHQGRSAALRALSALQRQDNYASVALLQRSGPHLRLADMSPSMLMHCAAPRRLASWLQCCGFGRRPALCVPPSAAWAVRGQHLAERCGMGTMQRENWVSAGA